MPVQVRKANYCKCGKRIYPQETGCYKCAIAKWFEISGKDTVDRLIKFPKFTLDRSSHFEHKTDI